MGETISADNCCTAAYNDKQKEAAKRQILLEQTEEANKVHRVSYEDLNMIPNITPKTILQHLPCNKFKKPSWQKPPCVILACGSFSPPTYLHLRIMEEAKDCLEKDFEVIGGIISPVNDEYGRQLKASLCAATGKHRIAMTQLATQTSEWIGVSDFEVSLDKWTRVAVVLEAYGKAINYYYNQQELQNDNDNDNDMDSEEKQSNEKQVHLKFLCGSDLLKSMQTPNLWRMDHQEIILGQYGTAVVERAGYELTDEFFDGYEMFKKYKKQIHTFLPAVENKISSTKVRQQLKNKQSVKYLTPDSVIQYIHKERLYE